MSEFDPWCWTKTKWICRGSADVTILNDAVKTYRDSNKYEYGNYFALGLPQGLYYNPFTGPYYPDGSYDVTNADGTYNSQGNGKKEIMCYFLVNNTLNRLGYHSLPYWSFLADNLGQNNEYLCPVSWDDARPGDILIWRNGNHYGILSSIPKKGAVGNQYYFQMFSAVNFKIGINYTNHIVDGNTGWSDSDRTVSVWRPKVKVIELKCKEPHRPPDHALYQYHGDPLMLDLDGGGIQTVGLDAGVHFDHDDNGFKELTGWVASGDGMLMLDKNGNGLLDDGSELFGDSTILPDGIKAANGFQALAYYDANHDGKIDANDPIWQQLRIWQPDTYVLPQGYG